ncbi:Gamma-Aminobutyric Acid Receptor Subunit Gamma-1 [Manis pentadactyla]|nr:Gamma-Aminobutyric Acid Receptor Subunit Gamma-1 [Manis pentadactyla]
MAILSFRFTLRHGMADVEADVVCSETIALERVSFWVSCDEAQDVGSWLWRMYDSVQDYSESIIDIHGDGGVSGYRSQR